MCVLVGWSDFMASVILLLFQVIVTDCTDGKSPFFTANLGKKGKWGESTV